jgi:hypothetical protein
VRIRLVRTVENLVDAPALWYLRERKETSPMAKRASVLPRESTSKKARTQPVAVVAASSPAHDAIARRAFELYLTRGQSDGADVNDWLRAESELACSAAIGP